MKCLLMNLEILINKNLGNKDFIGWILMSMELTDQILVYWPNLSYVPSS